MDFVFVLKKVLSLFLSPISFALEMLIIGVLLVGVSRLRPRKARSVRKKRINRLMGQFGLGLIASGILCIYLFSIDPITHRLVYHLERQYPPLEEKNGKYLVEQEPEFIVVLAGGHQNVAGRPELARLNYASYVRVTNAAQMWRQFPQAKLVLTGTPKEIEAMRLIAEKFDVPPDQIIEESESRDTKDHPGFVKKIVEDAPFLLVTSGTHMPRAMLLFLGHGLDPVPAAVDVWFWPEDPKTAQYHPGHYFPSSANVYSSSVAVHELLGMTWASFRGQDSVEK